MTSDGTKLLLFFVFALISHTTEDATKLKCEVGDSKVRGLLPWLTLDTYGAVGPSSHQNLGCNNVRMGRGFIGQSGIFHLVTTPRSLGGQSWFRRPNYTTVLTEGADSLGWERAADTRILMNKKGEATNQQRPA